MTPGISAGTTMLNRTATIPSTTRPAAAATTPGLARSRGVSSTTAGMSIPTSSCTIQKLHHIGPRVITRITSPSWVWKASSGTKNS